MAERCALIMAGGTGGHVFPALATARELIRRGWRVEWLGTRAGIEARLVPEAGLRLHVIDVSGLRGKGRLSLLLAPLRLLRALWQASGVISEVRPDLVVGMGGFASGPGGLAAWLRRIPLLIHEQNAIPGLTNRILARLATKVAQAFPAAFPERQDAVTTGNPVRSELVFADDPAARYRARTGSVRMLVVGGSLGARALNELLPEAVAALPEAERPEIWHQTGARNMDAARAAWTRAGIEVRLVPFIDDMVEAYQWADWVLCRSGALTVSELAAVGVAAALVPYPHAVDDHQTANAHLLADAGAAELVPQSSLTAERLAGLIRRFSDRGRLAQMAVRARQCAMPDAAKIVADLCEECCR